MWLGDIKFLLNRGCFHQLRRKCNQKLLLLMTSSAPAPVCFCLPRRKQCLYVMYACLSLHRLVVMRLHYPAKSEFIWKCIRAEWGKKMTLKQCMTIWALKGLHSLCFYIFKVHSVISFFFFSLISMSLRSLPVDSVKKSGRAPPFKAYSSSSLFLALCFSPPFFKILSFHFPPSTLSA